MANFKVLVSNGFREHRMEAKLELWNMTHASVARIANSFVSEIIHEDAVDGLVTAEEIAPADANGRCYFYVEDWLVDIYISH